MQPWMIVSFLIALTINTVALVFTAFFRGYGTKKGENLATHEDIEKIVTQVQAVTQATKEIEARVSDTSWNRHRLLDLKTEKAFEMMKNFGSMDQLLSDMLGFGFAWRTANGGTNQGMKWNAAVEQQFMPRQAAIAETQWQLDAMMTLFFTQELVSHSRVSFRNGNAVYGMLGRGNCSESDSNEGLRMYRETRAKLETMLREAIEQ
jgi:hypothetical protein